MPGAKMKQKLKDGKLVVVISGDTTTDILDQLGPLGFDGAWIDTEHGPYTWEHMSDISRVCDLWEMASLIRVTTNDPSIIMRTLDRGINGVVVPHVNTKEEAAAVVDAAKYHPIGHRGVGGGRQGYGVPDYINKANDDTVIVAMIEDIAAVNRLDEILNVEHIDAFFVARHDLAQSMGHLGQPTHPEVFAATERALKQIIAAGRVAGGSGADQDVERLLDMGMRFFMINWTAWVMRGATDYLRRFKS